MDLLFTTVTFQQDAQPLKSGHFNIHNQFSIQHKLSFRLHIHPPYLTSWLRITEPLLRNQKWKHGTLHTISVDTIQW